MPKNDYVKIDKNFYLFIRISALWIRSQTSKRLNAVIGSIAINLLLTYTDFPENTTSKASIIIGHTTVVQKRLGAPDLSQHKKKAKVRAFRTGMQ